MLQELRSETGRSFETSLMRMMNQHHRQAIAMASPCLYRAGHRQLVALCGSTIRSQALEIFTLQGWFVSLVRPVRGSIR